MNALRIMKGSKLFIMFFLTLFVVFAFSYVLFVRWFKIQEILKLSVRLNKIVNNRINSEFNRKLLDVTQCHDRRLESLIVQHGNFWVLQNFVKAEKQFRCSESVTYTTQGDYTFLDNLVPLVEHWNGPVSLALHAPGTDFQPTLDSIAYLRNCQSPLIKKFVSFHIVFDFSHAPIGPSSKNVNLPIMKLYKDDYNCSKKAPYVNISHKNLYKAKANISYPINVARNVARESAQTHFVLASDIELYPSPNIIDQFLKLVVKNRIMLRKRSPTIFVLPVFEILANESMPTTKSELKEMFNESKAFSFHKQICNRCHAIPHLEEWMALNETTGLDIFFKTKRQRKYVRWEAVYIGTNEDPWFDERLDWERHGNKMSQAYIMCLLDYDYMVLDNAFLVHKPGIKEKMVNSEIIPVTAEFINKTLGSQIKVLYGERKGCLA